MSPGDLIRVSGLRGEFRVHDVDDRQVAAWGPVGSGRAKWRTFLLARVTSVRQAADR